jgi:hypothetical protein
VLDYMRCLFWTSPLWTPSESLANVNKPRPEGIFILNQGSRLIYGDATHLVAWYVKDLNVQRDAFGNVIMEWTAPNGTQLDPQDSRLVPMGVPFRRKYVSTVDSA